jgi:Ca-activated chloride channel family protein
MKTAAVILTVLAGLACPAFAQDTSGTLVPVDGGPPLEIESQDVDVRINNGIAVTAVTQVFRNNRNQPLEAVWSFPVPNEASVSNFSMWINGKEVIGEVLEKKRARQIYEQITSQRRDPGLLEQVSYKLFEVRVFPVPANGTQKMQIAYYQPVEYDTGVGTYVYPMESKTRTGSRVRGSFTMNVRILSDIPLKSVQSPSHKEVLAVKETLPGLWRASMETPRGMLDRDFVIVYEQERERSGFVLVPFREDGNDGYFMLLLTAGKELDRDGAPANYIFVLDVSGSMKEDQKLAQAVRMLEGLLARVGPKDRFNVVSFNIAPEVLFREGPQPATAEARARAAQFLRTRQAQGGTEIVPALEAAAAQQVEGLPNVLVLLSDGNATNSEDHSRYRNLLEGKEARTRVFSVGIGNEVNRPLLSALAKSTGGYCDFVSSSDDAARKAALLAGKMLNNSADRLEVSFQGVEVYDVTPREMPSLFRGSQVALYGRYRKPGTATVAVKGKIGGEDRTISREVLFSKRESDNPEVRRMWAWKRTDDLMAEVRLKGETDRLVKEIVKLGQEHSIATPYTSFLVLESDGQYKDFGIEQRNARQVRQDRAAQQNRWDTRTVSAPSSGGGGFGGGGSIELGALALVGVLAGSRWIRRRK